MSSRHDDVDLGASVDAALLRHAEKSERVLAWIRASAMTPIAILNTAAGVGVLTTGKPTPLSAIVPAVLGAVCAWLFVIHLRRGGYRRSMQIAVPLLEGTFLVWSFVDWVRAMGPVELRANGSIGAMVAICAIFAQSGALRLNRASIGITTGFALLLYLWVAAQVLSVPIAGIGLAALLACGVLSYVLTGIVRGAVRSEIARLTLRRFLPSHVVDGAHDDPLRLITEPRSVDATVVITDIRGFTAWAEDRSPAEVLARLNDLQGTFAEHVREQGGTVDKFMGDGMLAVFGAPEPTTDHAERALATVQAIRQSMSRVADFQVGIGVHSGELVMGCLGKGLRLEFTVIGDTVNTASRLEALTKNHAVDVLMSGAFKERLAQPAPLISLGEVSIRGRKQPLPIYAFAGKGPAAGATLE